MKHVTDTSKGAYRGIKEDGTLGAQQRRILRVLEKSYGPMSRREISEATGIETSAVAGRVNKLIELGLLLEHPRRKCRFSKINIIPVSTREQMSLSFSH